MRLPEYFKLHISFAFRACIIFLLSRDDSRGVVAHKWIMSKYGLRKKIKRFFNCQQDDVGSLSERECEQPGSSKPAGGTDVFSVFIKQFYSIECPANHLEILLTCQF